MDELPTTRLTKQELIDLAWLDVIMHGISYRERAINPVASAIYHLARRLDYEIVMGTIVKHIQYASSTVVRMNVGS